MSPFESTRKVLKDDMPDMNMIYVAETFETTFKNISLPGYYDKVGPSVYVRRGLSRPDYQTVYCYKLNSRWCIGPHLGAQTAWAYSGVNETHPTGRFAWYENVTGTTARTRSKTIRVYPTKSG